MSLTPVEIRHVRLARGVGYQALPSALPPIDRGALPTEAELRRERVEEVLLAEGFQEIVTNGFYSRQLVEALGIGVGVCFRVDCFGGAGGGRAREAPAGLRDVALDRHHQRQRDGGTEVGDRRDHSGDSL